MGSNISDGNITVNDSFTYKMTINLDMFCTLMKNKIGIKMKCGLIVTIQLHRIAMETPRESRKDHNQNNSKVVVAIA